MTSISFRGTLSFRGTFKSFWDLTEVSVQSWYNVRSYELVNPTFKISLYRRGVGGFSVCGCQSGGEGHFS